MKMKKWKIIKMSKRFLFLFLLLFTFGVKADFPSCVTGLARGAKNELSVGDIVTINFGNDNSNTNMFIHRYSYKFWYDSNIFEIVKENGHYITTVTDWNIISEDTSEKNYLSFVIETNNKGRMVAGNNNILPNSIASLKLKVKNIKSDFSTNNTSNISLAYPSTYTYYGSNSPYTDPNYEEEDTINCELASVTLYLKEEANTLSSIKIDGKLIDNYNENTNTYNILVSGDKETINIEATKKDSKASVAGDLGTKKIQYGLNTFKIVVTSESGKKNEYVLNVTKKDTRSNVNTLKTLKLSAGVINFKPEITEYTINVTNAVDSIKIESTLTDSKAKFVNNSGNQEIELSEGGNKVLIKVVAENGDEKTYTLNINRALSGDYTLDSLYVNDSYIEVSNRVFNYTHEVDNSVTSVVISAYPKNSEATVEIGKLSLLEVGDNEVIITVTAPNGNKVTYTLNIIRKANLSNNSYLKNIIVEGYKLGFNKETTYYDLSIGNEDELVIDAQPEDEKTIVKIEGNKNLVDGSVIRITTHAENGDITRYFITVEKEKTSPLLWVIILLIVLIVAAVVVVIILLKKRKKMINKEKTIENTDNKIEEEHKEIDKEDSSMNVQEESNDEVADNSKEDERKEKEEKDK